MTEHINHPSHYGGGDNPFETIKVIESWGMGWQFCAATAVKYIMRAGKKGGEGTIKDLRKALWYLNRIVEKNHEPTAPLIYSKDPLHVEDVVEAWDLSLTLHDALTAITSRRIKDAKHWVLMEIANHEAAVGEEDDEETEEEVHSDPRGSGSQ